MRRGHWISLVLLFGCSSPNVERQSIADGTWRVKCKFGLEQCVREVEKLCPDPTYQIQRGNSVRKLYGVDPGKTEIRTSELTVSCGRDAVKEAETKDLAPDAGATPTRTTACTPGATQSCLGPGACAGAQACRSDGAGFMPCDCGGQPRSPLDAGVADAPADK
jgi:hypothetical protein